MKIISGIYRGIKIDTAKDVSYRPTKSRVRKSIFDVITPFDFSSVLDLFSGSGILGFESISRGASVITFVEKDAKSIRLLHRNREKFEGVQINIIKNKVELFLKNTNNSFDLIFADPPYDKIDYNWLFNSCIKKLSKNGKLIVEMNKNNFLYENCIEKVYGDTKVLLYHKS
jgi:16S rRNA (guanine966-N2)-methyltransferase